jgi:hypothetical protein
MCAGGSSGARWVRCSACARFSSRICRGTSASSAAPASPAAAAAPAKSALPMAPGERLQNTNLPYRSHGFSVSREQRSGFNPNQFGGSLVRSASRPLVFRVVDKREVCRAAMSPRPCRRDSRRRSKFAQQEPEKSNGPQFCSC